MRFKSFLRFAVLSLAVFLFSQGCEDDHSSSLETAEDAPPADDDQPVEVVPEQSRELVTYVGYWLPPDYIVHNGTNYSISNNVPGPMMEIIDLNNPKAGAISILMNVKSVPPATFFYITELGPTVWDADTFTISGTLFVTTESSPETEYNYSIQFSDESSGVLRIPDVSGGLNISLNSE